VLCTELESSKQQLAKQGAEAQAESSSLRDEVGRLLEECAALRSEMSSEVAEREQRRAQAEPQAEDLELSSSRCEVQTAVKLEDYLCVPWSVERVQVACTVGFGRCQSGVVLALELAVELWFWQCLFLNLADLQVSLHHKHRKPAELKEPCSRFETFRRLEEKTKAEGPESGNGSELFLLRHYVQMSAFPWQPVAVAINIPGKALVTDLRGPSIKEGFQCALLRFNSQRTELSCWGQNDKGQLGQGDTLPRPNQQAPVLLGAQVVQISSGAYHSCALLQTGEVKCWGANNRGQLGLGDSANRGDDPKEMGDFLAPVGLGPCKALEVRLGLEHSCARLDDGRVKCWGANGQGQARTGGPASIGLWPWELGEALVPEPLGTGRRAIGLLAGSWHSCAILDDQTSKCWGSGAEST
ncbi:Rcbtb1, partial [Symbiodinium sp. CCMP2456]